jgi:DNA-binding transcriptional ArsR family regulator
VSWRRNPAKGRGIDKKGRSKSEPYFLAIPYVMAESAAWRSLSGPAVKVYVELRRRFVGYNNGKLTLSLDEGARLLGLGKATVSRALRELQDKGFVKLVKRGRWYGRMASEYAVTDRPLDGNYPTNDWKNWLPPKPRKTNSRFRDGPIGLPDGTV